MPHTFHHYQFPITRKRERPNKTIDQVLMASSKGQVSEVLLMILMLLVTESPRMTDAEICPMTCLLGCLNGSIIAYPICGANCFLQDCKVKPSPSEDNLLQCKTSCIMTTCMRPNLGNYTQPFVFFFSFSLMFLRLNREIVFVISLQVPITKRANNVSCIALTDARMGTLKVIITDLRILSYVCDIVSVRGNNGHKFEKSHKHKICETDLVLSIYELTLKKYLFS